VAGRSLCLSRQLISATQRRDSHSIVHRDPRQTRSAPGADRDQFRQYAPFICRGRDSSRRAPLLPGAFPADPPGRDAGAAGRNRSRGRRLGRSIPSGLPPVRTTEVAEHWQSDESFDSLPVDHRRRTLNRRLIPRNLALDRDSFLVPKVLC